MIYLMKYKFYRMCHNVFTYIIIVLCCMITLVFTDKSYLINPIAANTPKNLTGFFMNETADAGIAIVIIVGCFVIYGFSNDLKQRLINYELISGNSRSKIFLSHYLFNFLLSGSLITGALLTGGLKNGLASWKSAIWNDIGYYLRTILLIYIISFSIISLCMIFAVLFKDTAKTIIITFIFLFLVWYIMAAIVSLIASGSISSAYENPPLILLFYPPYTWRWVLNPELKISQILGAALIAFLWCGAAFSISTYLFCKTEFK